MKEIKQMFKEDLNILELRTYYTKKMKEILRYDVIHICKQNINSMFQMIYDYDVIYIYIKQHVKIIFLDQVYQMLNIYILKHYVIPVILNPKTTPWKVMCI